MIFKDFCRTEIEFLNLPQLRKFLSELDGGNTVLVLSESACLRYGLRETVEQMGETNPLLWIKEQVSYPTPNMLWRGWNQIKGFQAEVIVAIGGGSAIDFAKCLKALHREELKGPGQIAGLLRNKKELKPKKDLKIIAVPTTAGTGAEVTKWATVWDLEQGLKYSLDQEELKPDKAVIVPELTAKAGMNLTISTGLDALSHAAEAYWAKKSSVLVRQLSSQAIDLILKNLLNLIREPENLLYRERQCLGSVLSGIAFSATRTTACHSISYPLTMKYNIPHGIAVAITLAPVAELNRGHFQEEEALWNLFQPYGGIRKYLEQVCQGRVSLNLRDYGVEKQNLEEIADHSFTAGRMDNNPVDIGKEDVIKLLREIL